MFVRDLQRARELYEALGLTVRAEAPAGIFMSVGAGTISRCCTGLTSRRRRTIAAFQVDDLRGVFDGSERELRETQARIGRSDQVSRVRPLVEESCSTGPTSVGGDRTGLAWRGERVGRHTLGTPTLTQRCAVGLEAYDRSVFAQGHNRWMSALTELAYDSAMRALDLQERAVEQLRARTGTLLAASSLTASFLGAQTVQHTSGLGTLGALALVSLACSIGLCVYILLPKSGFVFSLSAPRMYESLFEHLGDDDEVRRRLIYWLEEFWKANQIKIDGLGRYFLGAAIALMLQLVFWTWALAGSIS